MSDRVVRRILAPMELSTSGEPDMSYAIRLAAQLRADLILLVVIDTPATVNLIGKHRHAEGSEGQDFNTTLISDAKQIVQSVVDDAAVRGVKALGHVIVNEETEEQILKEALVHKVDLILVRSQGRGPLIKALLGSTAGEILKAAPCPVLVARA